MESLVPSDIIGSPLQITIKNDGRILSGVLLALDNKPNLLLSNVSELSLYPSKNHKDRKEVIRDLGLVSVPLDTIETVKIDTKELEKTIDWKSNVI